MPGTEKGGKGEGKGGRSPEKEKEIFIEKTQGYSSPSPSALENQTFKPLI